MEVTSTDFVPIVPYKTNSLNIGIGQRYDVIVTADQPTASYFLRGINQVQCGVNYNDGLGTANGIIQYEGADSTDPTSTYAPYIDACEDEPLGSLVPVVSKTVDSSDFAAQASTLPVNLSKVDIGGESLYRWFLNDNSMVVDWSNPTLAQVAAGNTSFLSSQDVITLPTANTWTYWVIQNTLAVPHPMHLHGHDFSILGSGNGTFDVSMVSQLNFQNPPRRDVTVLPSDSVSGTAWTVIAFPTDNPGAWLMHCHIAYHVADGLSLQFLEVPSQIVDIYGEQSANFRESCDKWNAYADGPTPPMYNKTGSGLR